MWNGVKMKLKDGPLKTQILEDVKKYNELPKWARVYKRYGEEL